MILISWKHVHATKRNNQHLNIPRLSFSSSLTSNRRHHDADNNNDTKSDEVTPISLLSSSTTTIKNQVQLASTSSSPSSLFLSNDSKQSIISRRGGGSAVLSTGTTLVRNNVFRNLRLALAGGIAGATGTALLYPIDTAKTLRQADPIRYTSVPSVLKDLARGVAGENRSTGMVQAYSGVLTATIFSIPSSALYFGAYETSKNYLARLFVPKQQDNGNRGTIVSSPDCIPSGRQRFCIHGLSAFCGNACSSLIFVPKEFIKQQMQAYGSGAMTVGGGRHIVLKNKEVLGKTAVSVRSIISDTIREKGIKGIYCGYRSTLMRNVPSAVMRFAIYEELKLILLGENEKAYSGGGTSPVFFLSGALAGAIASGFMTPLDVIKTKISTQTIPPNLGVIPSAQWIVKEFGWQGLYAGAKARMVWSGAFSAIGFGTYEAAKKLLGVSDNVSLDINPINDIERDLFKMKPATISNQR